MPSKKKAKSRGAGGGPASKQPTKISRSQPAITLKPGPRKPKLQGPPEPRLSTHKPRSVWFQARASWPVRDAPVRQLVEARIRSLRAPKAKLASQWENAGPSNIGG